MKRIIFSSCLLLFSVYINAQKIGVTFSSFGQNNVIRFVGLEGAASYSSDHFYILGITCLYPLNRLEIETGLEYASHTLLVKPNLPPAMDNSPHSARFSLMNIPLTFRINFLKYFFLNGGVIIDIDISSEMPLDKQTGIGSMLGAGVKYDFDFGGSVFVNPYMKLHSLVPFFRDNYHQRLLESGIKLGISYNFDFHL